MRSHLQFVGATALLCVVIAISLGWAVAAAPARSGPAASPAAGRAPQDTPTPACGLGGWAVVSPVPEAAAAIGVAADSQVAYAAGGLTGGAVLTRFAHYAPGGGAWGLLAALPTGADGIGLVTVPGRSQIYALGGADAAGNSLTTTQIYDPAANSWSSGVPLPGPRSRAATLYSNNAIYLIGGGTTRSPASGQAQTWEFDLATSTWNTGRAPLPAARVSPGYGAINGHIYVLGGRDLTGAAVSTVYDYDIAADTWTLAAPLPVAVAGAASALAAGRIVLAGGGTPLRGAPRPAAAPQVPLSTTVTQIFDPVANSWSAGPPLTIGRADLGGAAIGAYLVAVGGGDAQGTVYSTTEIAQVLAPCPATTATPTATPVPPTPTATSTSAAGATATAGAKPTATATPPGICYTYTISASPGRLLPGSHDIGNHCDECTTEIDIPFFVPLYDGPPIGGPAGPPIMKGRLSPNGYGTFALPTPTPGSAPDGQDNVCLPAPGFTYTIFPHWDDQRTDCPGCGIFTATVGCEPDRTFIIEWRTAYVAGGGTADFALELHEESSTFDVVYGAVGQGGTGATVGLQRDPGTANQYECNSGGLTDGLRLTFTRTACGTIPTPTPTAPAAATPTACAVHFSDVPVGDPFYAPIRCLACRGILSGYADGTFRPGNPVTRGQMAKILANSAAFVECIPPQQQTFADVPPAQPFWLYVERVALYQTVSGYTCGGPGEPCDPLARPYFRAFTNLTRGQLAKIAANGANYHEPVPAAQQTFADVPPASPFWAYVERLHNRSIVSGYACGGPGEPCDAQHRPYYRPFGNVTRGQTAKIAANTFYPNCQAP